VLDAPSSEAARAADRPRLSPIAEVLDTPDAAAAPEADMADGLARTRAAAESLRDRGAALTSQQGLDPETRARLAERRAQLEADGAALR
jgi:hypothetical protein